MRKTYKWLCLITILFIILAACAAAEGTCQHIYEQLILKAATCTEKGIAMQHCTLCSARHYEAIEPTHTYREEPDVVVAPSCDEAGGNVWYCTICNADQDPEAEGVYCETIPAAHCFGAEIKYIPASCNHDGKFVRYCTTCGLEDVLQWDENAKQLRHNWQYVHLPADCETAERFQIVCLLCGDIRWEMQSRQSAPAGHVMPEEVTVIAQADCQTAALLAWDCVACSEHIERTEGEAVGHTIEDIIIEEATCQQPGVMQQVCTVCGETIAENIVIPASEECQAYEIIIAPSTCTENGIREYRCKWCDEHLYFATIPFGHEAGDIETVKQPSCEENGLGQVHCTVCNELLKEIVLPTSGHVYEGQPVLKTSDCTNESFAVIACSACGNEIICAEDEERETPVHQRAYRYIAPDCESCGTLQVYCSVCDEILLQMEVTDDQALGHLYAESKTVIDAPDCVNAGTEAWVCARCNVLHDATEVPPVGHSLEMKVISEATCLENGLADRVCTVCSETIEKDIILPQKDTCEVTQEVLIASSCTHDGLCQYVCKWCDQTMGYAILPAGHVAGEAQAVILPDCQHEGLEQISCSICGEKMAENVLPKTEHIYTGEPFIEAATCTEPEKMCYACDVCHAAEAEKVVPVGDCLGHRWQAETTKLPADCVTPAAEVKVCEVCHATEVISYDRNTPALGHQIEYVLINPTCTEPMMVSGICSVCGHEIEREAAQEIEGIATAVLGHTEDDEWLIIQMPTCQEKGLRRKVCLVCGEIAKEEEMPTVPCQGQIECTLQHADCKNDLNAVTLLTCQWCGEIVHIDVTQYEHTFNEETSVVLLEPTCETEGLVLNTCKLCGFESTIATAAIGHTASEPVVLPADCDSCEQVVILCTTCGETLRIEAEMGDALGHAFDVYDPQIGKNVCIFCREVQPN